MTIETCEYTDGRGGDDICPRTLTRTAACSCRKCTRRQTPAAKHATNKRDVLALLSLLEGCVRHPPHFFAEEPTWGDVGTMADLRERLMGIAVGLALGPDASEEAARRGIEQALGDEDESVGVALIGSIS